MSGLFLEIIIDTAISITCSKQSNQIMHFMKPVWHSLTANLLPLAVPFFLFLFLTFVFNHHLFSLTSLFPLFTSPSPVLFLATISFPLLSSPSFLCSALLLIFCPIHEVLLPEGVFKLHPAKKKKKAPQNPSSSQSQLTECYFLRLCLHDSVGGYLLLFFLFFFSSVDLVNHEPFLLIVAHACLL